jgi:hypothetical protein
MTREAFLVAFLRSLADDFGVCGSRYEVAAEYLREAAGLLEQRSGTPGTARTSEPARL